MSFHCSHRKLHSLWLPVLSQKSRTFRPFSGGALLNKPLLALIIFWLPGRPGGVRALVVPSPQAKGKIERGFGTFQNRRVILLAYEKIIAYAPAQELLAHELARQNRTVCRTTGRSPDDACAKAHEARRTVLRPCPDPAGWTSIWRSTSAAASTPTNKLFSAGTAGRSVPPPGIP